MSRRPFAHLDAVDCRPPRVLRWRHLALVAGALAIVTFLIARSA
jgi:hypothetical protein